MGLDTTHNCWQGSYSSFNTFRYELAKLINVNLDEYLGYSDNGTKHLEDINHGIMPLLNHSDCDGELNVNECKQIVEGLNDILSNNTISNEYILNKIIRFRDGCLEAIEKNENVEFH